MHFSCSCFHVEVGLDLSTFISTRNVGATTTAGTAQDHAIKGWTTSLEDARRTGDWAMLRRKLSRYIADHKRRSSGVTAWYSEGLKTLVRTICIDIIENNGRGGDASFLKTVSEFAIKNGFVMAEAPPQQQEQQHLEVVNLVSDSEDDGTIS